MFEHKGIWFPDGEQHMPSYMARVPLVDGKATYQWEKIQVALRRCRPDRRRVAVDVGGHVGLWSMHLAKVFGQVHAFEPIPRHQECFARNVPQPNVALHRCALGDNEGTVHLYANPDSSGGSRVEPDGGTVADLRTLDSFALQDVDFLKADCEGFEWYVLKGGEQTLLRCRPVIVVEQRFMDGRALASDYGLRPLQAVEYLESLGARQFHLPKVDDYFFDWPLPAGEGAQ